jgi:hypothetical protein
MRLPQIAAAMWLQTASRAVLNLISTRGLTRPFAPKFAPFPQVKYLHVHDGTKQPDAEVKTESEGSSAPDQLTPGAQNGDIDAKIALESNLAKDKDVHTAAPRYSRGKHPNSAANQLRYNEEQRALGWPKLKARNEQQRALGWPKLKAGREKFQQEQRALGSQNAWQGVKKAVEAQRAAGFPHQKALAEKQRAAGWHSLKAYHEKARAEGYKIAEVHHAKLSRDMAAANERKLAEDPTFQPLPLPVLGSRAAPTRINKRGTVLCPHRGCRSQFSDEKKLKTHLINKHNEGHSEEAPHKCDFAGCNLSFETKAKARRHFKYVHTLPTAKCPLCDRVICNKYRLEYHLREIHGQP